MDIEHKPGHGALRKGRHSQTNQIYLVTTTTEEREPLFCDWRVGRLVVTELRRLEEAGSAQTFTWALMPDHLHWLVQLSDNVTLSDVVRQLKGRSARRVNRALGRTGAVWQRAYHDHALREEEDLKATARYVIANPLRAGMVESIGDYPLWDSVWL